MSDRLTAREALELMVEHHGAHAPLIDGDHECGELLVARDALAEQERTVSLDDEDVARLFHEAYERLAPSFGYETRAASAKPWPEVPENNRRLMTAVLHDVRAALAQRDREGTT